MNCKSLLLRSCIVVISVIAAVNTGAAQDDCNFTMGCNDEIHLSIGTDCVATITVEMMLETPIDDPDDYQLTVRDEFNQEISADVGPEYAGRRLKVSVEHIECANSCWGYVLIENKLGPIITDCRDTMLTCQDSLLPGNDVPMPEFFDPCGGEVDAYYTDSVDIRPCGDDLEKFIVRTWVVTDEDGNTATCRQEIEVEGIELSSIVFPPSYDGLDEPAFECSDFDEDDLLENGAPSPDLTGFPTGIECPKIQFHFSDKVFPSCGASKKILRTWTVVDWCTSTDTIMNQLIKILDTEPPVCTLTGEEVIMISTSHHDCTGTYEVPPPPIEFECSDYTYTVSHKAQKAGEGPLENLTTEGVTLDDSIYTISGLPLDTSYIVYTIEDACLNRTQCFFKIVVEDDKAPTAVCEGYTVISLDNRGVASMLASSIDDYSWDNCGIDSFAIRKDNNNCDNPSDQEFGSKIYFCCEDAQFDYVMVTFRVYDFSGNFNECRTRVKVQDKIPPVLTCPRDVTIDCSQDIDDLVITGRPIVEDNCNPTIRYEDDDSGLNNCGSGLLRRTWIADDPNGSAVQCVQLITIVPEYSLDPDEIDWPRDVTLDGCTDADIHPDGPAGKPMFDTSACLDLAIAYHDQAFYDVEDVCMKIIRTWKVADWCSFNPLNPVYAEYKQIIKLIDNEAPTFLTGCGDRTFTTSVCTQELDILVVASDNCADDLKYRYFIDYLDDGSIDFVGSGQRLRGSYRVGNYKIIFEAEDDCSNIQTCEFEVLIRAEKAPTPICLSEVVWVMEPDGETEVWASDFDQKSINACGDGTGLKFSFTEDGNTPAINFTCDSLPNGISREISLQMWVIDNFGMRDYCDVTLILQDNNNNDACTNDPNARAQFTGNIITSADEGVSDIEIMLKDISQEKESMGMTENGGNYSFNDIEYFNNYQVQPVKKDEQMNGVTTIDLVAIQQYLFGMRSITDPLILIAADVNGDRKVTGADMIKLRRLILGQDRDFGDNTPWKFISRSQDFSQGQSPWTYTELFQLPEVIIDQDQLDFTILKTGDVSGDAEYKVRGKLNSRTFESEYLYISQKSLNDHTVLSLASKDMGNLMGMQFTLDLGSKVEINKIEGQKLAITKDNYALHEGRYLTFSWGSMISENLDESELLNIHINRVLDLSNVKLNSGITQLQAFRGDGSLVELQLRLETNESGLPPAFTLIKNTPNPFSDRTIIEFDLPADGSVFLQVFDLNGRELYQRTDHLLSGSNQLTVHAQDLSGTGLLVYRLTYNGEIQSGKMLKIE